MLEETEVASLLGVKPQSLSVWRCQKRYALPFVKIGRLTGAKQSASAPKSVSLTALVGRDDRVCVAHRESVRVALQELECCTQARIGDVHAPETSGKFITATFEHNTARPVDGYAAPQFHIPLLPKTALELVNCLSCSQQDLVS